MMTILVTGGAGFIGSHLIEALLKEKPEYRVVCVDDLSSARALGWADEKENLRGVLDNSNFSFYEVDIRDQESLRVVFDKEKPEAVVHLAARADTRRSVEEPREYIEVNVDGTLNVFECARRGDVSKVVFASSSSVYGNVNTPPFSEDAQTDFPIAPYGASKKAGEILAYTYHHNFGMDIACIRIFNAYGERMRPGLVLYKWADAILHGKPIELSGEGDRRRDFTYVGDLVRGCIAALDRKIGFEVINIGNANPVSLRELLSVTEEVVGKKAEIVTRESHHASVEETHADVRKAKKVLDWEPTTSLKEGVSRFVAWFRTERLKETV